MVSTLAVRYDDQTHAGLQIPVIDLPPVMAHMRAGGVYWICAPAPEDATALCRQMLAASDSHAKAAVVGDEDFSGLCESVPPTLGPADTRFYQLKGNVWKGLGGLCADLDRVLRPRRRTIVAMFQAGGLREQGPALARLIARWQSWLRDNGCTMLLISRGAEAVALANVLAPMSEVLSGLAVMQAGETSGRTYQIVHWRNALGVESASSLSLAHLAEGFRVQRAASREHSTAWVDGDRVFIEQGACDDAAFAPPAAWRVCEGWAELRACGMAATDATLVFALTPQADLAGLARLLHALRRARGRGLKLVVRAVRRPVRYQDEQLLLDCGATIVAAPDVRLPGFLSLLDAVQGQLHARALAEDVDRLLEQRSPPLASGKVSLDAFLHQLEGLRLRNAGAQAGVLVRLTPVRGLSAEQVLTQLRVRRAGDIASHAEGVVYMFLAGCRPALANEALRRVFRLPFGELFSACRLYDMPEAIRQIDALGQLAAREGGENRRAAVQAPAAGEGAEGPQAVSAAYAPDAGARTPGPPPRLMSLFMKRGEA